MKKSISIDLQFAEGKGKLHGFTTGMVQVKRDYKTARGGALRSKLHFIFGKVWEPFIPIWVWVVEHPEGIFVVDTGENARVTEPDYFKAEGAFSNYLNTRMFRFEVSPEEEVGPQLARLNIQQADIKQVLLTHLHLDHFDGLHYFDETDIALHQLEWEKPSFALPTLYPKWFDPRPLKMETDPNGHFQGVHSLVGSGELQLIHTPGHTLGHSSVLVKTKDKDYLLAGDITYDLAQMEREVHSAGHQNFKLSAQSYKAVKKYAAQRPLVYLPSHCPDALERIEKGLTLAV